MSDELKDYFKLGIMIVFFILFAAYGIGYGLTQIAIISSDHEYRMAQLKCKDSK